MNEPEALANAVAPRAFPFNYADARWEFYLYRSGGGKYHLFDPDADLSWCGQAGTPRQQRGRTRVGTPCIFCGSLANRAGLYVPASIGQPHRAALS